MQLSFKKFSYFILISLIVICLLNTIYAVWPFLILILFQERLIHILILAACLAEKETSVKL